MRYFIQLLPGLLTLWAAAEGSEIYNDFCATMIFSDDSTIGDFSSLKTNMQNNIPVSIRIIWLMITRNSSFLATDLVLLLSISHHAPVQVA